MKQDIINSIKLVLADRKMLLLSMIIIVMGFVYILYVAFSLNVSELQLATRYTSFGNTHFYRNKWYYLVSFIILGIIFVIAHVGMIVKLAATEMKPLATAMAWLSIVVLVMMFSYTYHVLSIAYLS